MITEATDFWLCKDEQSFKMKYIKNVLNRNCEAQRIFCIETEETVKGFPDVMEVISDGIGNHVYLYEFKYSDKSGKIKFQPTQPAFYKANPNIKVEIVAFNKKTGNIHKFNADELFSNNSFYQMNMKAEVNLCKAEK